MPDDGENQALDQYFDLNLRQEEFARWIEFADEFDHLSADDKSDVENGQIRYSDCNHVAPLNIPNEDTAISPEVYQKIVEIYNRWNFYQKDFLKQVDFSIKYSKLPPEVKTALKQMADDIKLVG